MTLDDAEIGRTAILIRDGLQVTGGRIVGIDEIGPQRVGPCIHVLTFVGEQIVVRARELAELTELRG